MPIVSLKQLKERYQGIWDTERKDDELLEESLDRAQGLLELWSHRTLEAVTMKRIFNAPTDDFLMMDVDLLQVSQIINGDGNTVTPAHFYLLPLNGYPKYAIHLRNGAYWSADNFIHVTAKWGYILPGTGEYAAAQQALVHLAAYIYKQKDAQTFETVSFLEGGMLVIPDGIPRSVQEWLNAATRIM